MRPTVDGRRRGGATERKGPAPRSSGDQLGDGRALAASILASVDAGRRLDVAWEAAGADASAHRPWVRALVYGVIRWRGRLDYMLQTVSGRDPAALDPPVRLALRMGAYQLLEMKTVPTYAAVSESVRAVKQERRSRAAAGLVNAALRRLARAPPDFPRAAEDLEGFLATWGSHPRWLVRRWLRNLGSREAHRVVLANNEEPRTHLRLLPEPGGAAGGLAAGGHASMARRAPDVPEPGGGLGRSTASSKPCDPADPTAQAVRRLADAGIAAATSPGGVRLGRGVDPRAALRTVRAVVQDPAASRVVDYAAPAPGSLVIDLCAAPGGKALALAGIAAGVVADAADGGRGQGAGRPRGAVGVVAADASQMRLARVADALDRLRRLGGAPTAWPVVADARRPPIRTAGMAFLDAPCSATGVIRRRPDARWRLSEDRLRALAVLQGELLRSAAAVVPPGGLLVYATCSMEPEENGQQVSEFLSRHPEFRVEPGPAPERLLDDAGCLTVLPAGGRDGHDGAFAARMRREPAP